MRKLLLTVGGKFIVATIQRVRRKSDYVYRVLIRQAGMRSISKTFNTKRLANKFVSSIEGDRNKLPAYTQVKSHITNKFRTFID